MIVKRLASCWVARFGMTFYVYAYYFITKKDFDLIFFFNERVLPALSFKKKMRSKSFSVMKQ